MLEPVTCKCEEPVVGASVSVKRTVVTTSHVSIAAAGNTKKLACLATDTMQEFLPYPNDIFARTEESDFHIEI
jgi:hypothetical protein